MCAIHVQYFTKNGTMNKSQLHLLRDFDTGRQIRITTGKMDNVASLCHRPVRLQLTCFIKVDRIDEVSSALLSRVNENCSNVPNDDGRGNQADKRCPLRLWLDTPVR